MSQIDDLDVLSDSTVIRSAEFRAAEAGTCVGAVGG